jgi:hypothetical protein
MPTNAPSPVNPLKPNIPNPKGPQKPYPIDDPVDPHGPGSQPDVLPGTPDPPARR